MACILYLLRLAEGDMMLWIATSTSVMMRRDLDPRTLVYP